MGERIVDAGPETPTEPGEVRAIHRGDTYVAVARVGERWYTFADHCSHDGCPLADGIVDGSTIECQCHGSIFDMRTGRVLRGPAVEPIAVYPFGVRDGRLLVDVGDRASRRARGTGS
jgi:3-phenylpropionate/trans-cinnamate dioxygenase ferredoxin subunit